MTFKDLKKRVTLEALHQQSRLFGRLRNKSFWIWNIEEHKHEDARTNEDCCFNHIIGLPEKDGIDKPLYDYEKIIFDSLVTHGGNTNSYDGKHLDKESNRFRYFRIYAQVYGLALLGCETVTFEEIYNTTQSSKGLENKPSVGNIFFENHPPVGETKR